MIRPTLLALAAAALATPPALADVDRTPPPGGVYRLKPGLFVAEGARCADPANAELRRYDGRGISTAHTRGCVARVLSRRRHGFGTRYRVSQACLDAGAGPAKRFTERQTVDVPDALTFTVRSKDATTYRYCPIGQLPPELRAAGTGR